MQSRIPLVLCGALLYGACHCPSQRVAPTKMPFRPRVDMTSAMIDSLCVHPDSVRAGLVDCVLKDQALPAKDRMRPNQTPK